MKNRKNLFAAILMFIVISIQAQDTKSWDFERKHYIGTQAFMIMTPLVDPSPEYYQLNYGYRISPKDEISIEAITWTYQGPLGRAYGPDYEKEETSYPGDVKSIGGGLAYKRLIWKGLFSQVHSTAFKQIYRDAEKNKIQTGFMLFNTVRFGYHFRIFKKRWFIAPSVAGTFWPISTNLPGEFQEMENRYPSFFLFEPGLQFGYTF